MCRPSKIDGRCVDLRRPIDDRCEIMLLYLLKTLMVYSCMRITPRVCTSVLSLFMVPLGLSSARPIAQLSAMAIYHLSIIYKLLCKMNDK